VCVCACVVWVCVCVVFVCSVCVFVCSVGVCVVWCVCNPKIAQLKKKCAAPQEGHCEKRCEIQGRGQEMTVIVG